MSEKRYKIPIGGEIVEGIGVEFEAIEENWNVYKLKDGTKLKIKVIPTRIVRAENKFNQLGEPVYHVAHQSVLIAEDIKEEFMKKD